MKMKTLDKPAAKTPEAAKPPVNKRRHPNAMPTSLDRNPIGMSPERRALYEEAQEHASGEEVTPPTEREEAEPEIAETPPEEGAAEPSPEEKETKDEEVIPEKEEAPKSDDDAPADKHTTVPYAALHEARQELKEVKAQVREVLATAETAQKQLQIMLQENERLRKQAEKSSKDDTPNDAPIDDLEGYVKSLGKKLQATQAELDRFKEQDIEERQRSSATKFNQAVTITADELKAEGYPGFEEFKEKVAAAIEARAKGDEVKTRALDNPEGWKTVYKEDVYPKISSIFGVVKKDTKKAEKEELKGKANLISGPGKQPMKSEDEPKKPWGLGTYFEMRQKNKPS